jgi:uncharacterized protein YdhG (YjbR/CyaY superfamily)
MKIEASTVDEYLQKVSAERQEPMAKLRALLRSNLPEGFEEVLSYSMPGYVVPHALYPKGYHCDPSLPLPFVSFASQKNFIALYHMGLYANEDHMAWFKASWDAAQWGKLDMGRSCIRFKNMDKIPWDLLSELATKITPQAWISQYEAAFLKS